MPKTSLKAWTSSWFGCLWLVLANLSCTAIIEGEPPAAGSGGTSTGGSPNGGGSSSGSPNGVTFAQCAACHGVNGEGTTLGYEVRHPVRAYATWVIRNGRPGTEFPGSVMLAYAASSLSDTRLTEIFDFLDSFPQPTDGQGLYLDYCRNCHGTNARGGVTGVDISDKEYGDILEKVRKGEGGTDYGNRPKYMPALDPSILSDAEVRAIADYIATL